MVHFGFLKLFLSTFCLSLCHSVVCYHGYLSSSIFSSFCSSFFSPSLFCLSLAWRAFANASTSEMQNIFKYTKHARGIIDFCRQNICLSPPPLCSQQTMFYTLTINATTQYMLQSVYNTSGSGNYGQLSPADWLRTKVDIRQQGP